MVRVQAGGQMFAVGYVAKRGSIRDSEKALTLSLLAVEFSNTTTKGDKNLYFSTLFIKRINRYIL